MRRQASVHGGCTNQEYATPNASFLMAVRKGESYQWASNGTADVTATFIAIGR